MLSKESKIRVLENFYSVDYVLFGKPISEVKSCCKDVIKDFINIKSALISTVTEIQKLTDHTPEVINEKINVKEIMKMSRASAKIARSNSKNLVISENGRNEVKLRVEKLLKEHKDIDINNAVQNEIRTKSFSLALDNLLIARMINESNEYNNLNEWEGKILEDSYKILRNDLVESAVMVLDLIEEAKNN